MKLGVIFSSKIKYVWRTVDYIANNLYQQKWGKTNKTDCTSTFDQRLEKIEERLKIRDGFVKSANESG